MEAGRDRSRAARDGGTAPKHEVDFCLFGPRRKYMSTKWLMPDMAPSLVRLRHSSFSRLILRTKADGFDWSGVYITELLTHTHKNTQRTQHYGYRRHQRLMAAEQKKPKRYGWVSSRKHMYNKTSLKATMQVPAAHRPKVKHDHQEPPSTLCAQSCHRWAPWQTRGRCDLPA